jgi:Tol biopolymer transport system component
MLKRIIPAALALTLATTAAAAQATFGGGVGRLAFPMGNGNVDIYTSLPDGSDLKQLTTDPGFDACPSWSPNGKQIAFCSNRTGLYQIWLMNADGSNQHAVTHDTDPALFPSWSPDGRSIVYQSNHSTPSQDNIREVSVAGGRPRYLTDAPGNDDYPVFSPDGKTIAFVSHRKVGPGQVWLMNADGSHPRQLTTGNPGKDELPDWSPDGKQIAYQAGGHIWLMNADGTRQRQLTHGRGGSPFDQGPRWSPDGKQLAFLRERGPLKQAWVMNADGSHAHAILPGNQIRQLLPAWQAIR